jgi:hypothetical protein
VICIVTLIIRVKLEERGQLGLARIRLIRNTTAKYELVKALAPIFYLWALTRAQVYRSNSFIHGVCHEPHATSRFY